MYWLYFILFLVAIATPIVIGDESRYLTEDMAETIVILATGALTFVLYVAKDKSLLRHVREKLWFQQKNTDITRDLSQSYSYIGEVNRKVDILHGMMHRLVEIRESGTEEERLLWEVLDTVKQLTHADRVSMRIFAGQACTHRLEEKQDKKEFSLISDTELLETQKTFLDINGIQIVTSKQLPNQTRICILFSKAHNDEIDEGMLSIILAFLAILDTFLPGEKK